MEKLEAKHKRARLEDVVPRSAPFSIFLDPCGACNFKCSFCPCNVSEFQAAERHKVMSWELFEKIAKDLEAFRGQVKVINLYGFGEPLLNPHIVEMVRTLKENHLCREVRITTNASLLDEEKSKGLIAAGVDLLRVSVEALSAEAYQELCGVKIDFSKVLHNVESFYKLSRGTESKIAAKIVSATLKTEQDRQRFFDLFDSITDYHFIEKIDAYWAEFDEMVTQEDPVKVHELCYKETAEKNICTYPFTDMCIHSNGAIGACCVDWKFATQYGDVRYEHLSDIWNGERHRKFQIAHLTKRLRETVPFCDHCLRKSSDCITNSEQILARLNEIQGA